MIICKKKRSINITFLKKNLPKICMFKNVLVLKELHVIMPYPLKKKCYHQIQESSLFHYLSMILKIFKWLPRLKKPIFFCMKNYFWKHFLYLKELAQSCFIHTIASIGFACHGTAEQSFKPSPPSVTSFLQFNYSEF